MHRPDRTGSRAARRIGVAALAACAALTACTGGDDDPAPSPTAAAPTSASVSASATSSIAPGPVVRREVARVPATIEFTPEGVKAATPPPICVQYELSGGGRPARYQVEVLLASNGRPAFTGPAGTKVFYKARVVAGGVAYDGRVTFRVPRDVDGRAVTDPDVLTEHGTLRFQPELLFGIQEVPAGMTGCSIDVRLESEMTIPEMGGLPLRNDGTDPLVRDVDGNERDIDEQ